MRWIPFYFLFLVSPLFGQQCLSLGNDGAVCLPVDLQVSHTDTLPANLDSIACILLFSGANSLLSDEDLDRLVTYVEAGGGLYSGSDNWPLQSEANQVTDYIYKKQSFGLYTNTSAECTSGNGHLELNTLSNIPAGNTTVAFPLDPRLRVEAWVNDQPLILSGLVTNGRIIIDGGYSRFYCQNRTEESDLILSRFIRFLLGN